MYIQYSIAIVISLAS